MIHQEQIKETKLGVYHILFENKDRKCGEIKCK